MTETEKPLCLACWCADCRCGKAPRRCRKMECKMKNRVLALILLLNMIGIFLNIYLAQNTTSVISIAFSSFYVGAILIRYYL